MNIRSVKRKRIARTFLLIWSFHLALPFAAHALTSGPNQPEAAQFQPAGVSDMVDLFTGDFKYNIPLLDIDGYPVNLNYASGVGMDDEASWVGLGWNLNVGSINRQVRGIPDDMNGDPVETDHYTKPKVTVGGRIRGKFELFQYGKLTGTGTFGLGIFNDNYTGIGADFSANAGVSFSQAADNGFTAELGLGINSNTASGVDVSPTLSLGMKEDITNGYKHAGLSSSLGYNSRSGLKNLTLGSSFSISGIDPCTATYRTFREASISGSFISFNTEPILPDIRIPYRSRYGSVSLDAGPAAEGFFISAGATGYKSVRDLPTKLPNTPYVQVNPAYGFLYAEKGKDQKNAMMDFIRENENPILPDLPHLAVPVHTPDLFTFSSQEGSGQFRLYRGGSGIFFDNAASDDDVSNTFGGDIGIGPNWGLDHAGVTWFNQTAKASNRKWTSNNYYGPLGDFQDASNTNPNLQHAYFKITGEQGAEDANMTSQVHDIQPLQVNIGDELANPQFTNYPLITNPITKSSRALNKTVVSYLTAEEADAGGLDRGINIYPSYTYDPNNTFVPSSIEPQVQSVVARYGDDNYHQPHHLSEITVTKSNGQRMVYGIPVYNIAQSEFTFALGTKGVDYNIMDGTNNIVPVPVTTMSGATAIAYQKGVDNYYHRQTQPAYAASFLLTAILSPDYVDRTGDGISDDDPGTAIKFNYSKLAAPFRWRTPFKGATLNQGLLADKDDDKGNIIYGEKEVWYLSSIESKTKVVYFITEARNDAYGVTDFTGANIDTSNPQRRLREIRMYSKADLTKPIKVIHFNYSYQLCPGVPNYYDPQGSSPGKLTLTSVYFTYGNSSKGSNFPYSFNYNTTANGQTVGYGDMLTDRWGVYKPSSQNTLPLPNDEFPYSPQDFMGNQPGVKSNADQNAAVWHLSSIQLPTGGTINVTYESDDYAYVQNRRAMAMTGVSSLIDANNQTVNALQLAKGVKVAIPNVAVTGDPTAWFENTYMDGQQFLYAKFLTKLSTSYYQNAGLSGFDNDFVSCYAQVQSVTIDPSGYADVIFQDRTDGGVTANPIVFAAWQKMKDDYPRYAFSGYDHKTSDAASSSGLKDALEAVLSSIGNLSELTEKFYHKAYRKSFASQVQLNGCFVKLVKQDGHKLGGGLRVKKIRISDDWQSMSGSNLNASYGQSYDYTTVENGVTISSGVAAYEPSVGNDENAMKDPVPYTQEMKGAVDDFFDLEKPFGESFFPAPSVGYSKVTVTDLDKNGDPDPTLRTGYTVNEFYTAKEFPVQVYDTNIDPIHHNPKNYFSFLGATSIDDLTMSEGYSIVVNDMHGKQKAVTTYNQAGASIASTQYYYHSDPIGDDEYKLDNTVQTVAPDGTVSSQVIGRDMDFFTDFREFQSVNSGRSVDFGYDVVGFSLFSIPIFMNPNYDDSDSKMFRSACSVKVTQCYGVIDKVVRTQDGSSITTQNLAFDSLTGEPVVTQTQNEFENYIYTVNQPAYWVYKGMGGAYQNAGILLDNFSTDANAGFNNGYGAYLKSGDEILDISNGNRYWVIEDQATGASSVTKKLVDRYGGYAPNFTASQLVKVVRSGYRNMLDATTSTLVTLVNPIQSGRLAIASNADLTSLKVINASAKTFNDHWSMNLNNQGPDYTPVLTGYSAAYGTVSGGSETFVNYYTTQTKFFDASYDDQTEFGKTGLFGSAIWPTPVTNPQYNQQVDIEQTINIPANSTGYYFIGFSGVGNYQYSIDNAHLMQPPSGGNYGIYLVQLSGGTHHLSMITTNTSSSTPYMALQIYAATQSASGSGLVIDMTNQTEPVFSTTSLTGSVPNYTYRPHINPYARGFLGNWREYNTLVFQQSRKYNTNLGNAGVDVKDAGYINSFSPYWYYGTKTNSQPGWVTDANGNRARWINANTVTAYDQYGQQIENEDALQRYSAALFGFNGELPVAVASNAKNREIYSNGFEDGKFSVGSPGYGNMPNQFKRTSTGSDDINTQDISSYIVNTVSHTGNYSVLLPTGGLTMTTQCYNASLGTSNLLAINNYGEYNFQTGNTAIGLYPNGFEPTPGNTSGPGSLNAGKYIFDVWVLDGHPTDKSVNLSLAVNSTNVTLTCKALVENWKLLEGTIDLTQVPTGTLTISISSSASNVYIDDLRMHPLDAEMKSYVYDDKTLRLMAELDENGFATLYEYDDEGLLIRVKKETERGVMTIKETRSSYAKAVSK